MSLKRISTGKIGEDLALAYLRGAGYKIIRKNYRTRLGEIDIIAQEGGCICFIEVRSAGISHSNFPEYSIRRKKQRRIIMAALAYIKKKRLEKADCRFDVIVIHGVKTVSPGVELIKNAFELDSKYIY